MQPTDLIGAGASAGAVALVLMFKMYIDKKRQNGIANPDIVDEVKALRREIKDRERREEMKPLASAINQLTISVREMHASHQLQVEVLKGIANKLSHEGISWKESIR